MDTAQPKRLYRSRQNRMITGVCGGLGEYFDIDPIIFRGVFILMVLPGGFGILFYVLLSLLIPNTLMAEQMSGSSSPKEQFKQNLHEAAHDFKERVNDLASEMRDDHWFARSRNLVGLFIILVGLFLLLQQFVPWRWLRWDIFWPLLLIIFGILILTRHRRNHNGRQ